MTIKKILFAVAIGATVAVPAALAQNVQIYGRLYPHLLNESGSGATPVGTPVATFAAGPTGTNGIGTTGMDSGNSRVGFRGQEDLGGGLKAIFQFEGVISVDESPAFSFNRDTFVGLTGGFGTVKLGRVDTIQKNYGDVIGIMGVSSGTFLSSAGVLRKAGFGTSNSSRFHERSANSIQYESPKISGFVAGLQYSTAEAAKTATRDPTSISMGVKYENGPWYAAIAHEIHNDLFGGSRNAPAAMSNFPVVNPTNSKDRATQFTVAYRLDKKHRFAFDLIRKEYKENATVAGRFGSYENTAYMLSMDNRWSEQWRTSAYYAKADAGSCTRIAAACVTDGLDGSKLSFGLGYNLSRRTMLFSAVSHLNNGKSARYTSATFGAPNPGETITQYALGLSHSF